MFFISGIFAYLNYHIPKNRKEIIDLLITGLKRLEYRGYDSAGKEKKIVGNIQPLSSSSRNLMPVKIGSSVKHNSASLFSTLVVYFPFHGVFQYVEWDTYVLTYKYFMFPGIAVDTADGKNISIIKKSGKVDALQQKILAGN